MKSYCWIYFISLLGFNCWKALGKESINIVIARYKESTAHLRWLGRYPHIFYNRGEKLVDSDVLHSVYQPKNVGREGWIYVDHIIKNYHNLSDINVFSQTSQSAISEIQFRKYVEALASGEMSLSGNGTDGFGYFGTCCLVAKFGMGSVGEVKHKYNISERAYERDQVGMHEIITKIIQKEDIPAPELLRFNPTAVFAVSRARIHSNPIAYYERLRDYVLGDGDLPMGHGEGIVVERSWAYIFNSHCGHAASYECALHHPGLKCLEQPQ